MRVRSVGARRVRVFIHSRHGLGGREVTRDYAEGLAHNPRPYGFEAAEHGGLSVKFSEDAPRRTRFQQFFWDRVGFDVVHAVRNLWAFRRADITWTLLEWDWLPLSLLQRLRLAPQRPIIGNSVWLMHDWYRWGPKRRWLWKWLMSENVYLTLHSEASRVEAAKYLPGKQFHVSPFGISTLAFPVSAPRPWSASGRPIRIYSIGDDRTRDWETLLEAFGNDDRFDVRIICRWIDQDLVSKYRNVRTPKTLAIQDQRESYRWADLVVVPMWPNVFSGITVACEAVAMGVPVVSSRTGGVPTYFNEAEILYVEPRSPEALRDAALNRSASEWEALAAAASERFERSDYSAAGMVKRYEAITRELVRQEPEADSRGPRLLAGLVGHRRGSPSPRQSLGSVLAAGWGVRAHCNRCGNNEEAMPEHLEQRFSSELTRPSSEVLSRTRCPKCGSYRDFKASFFDARATPRFGDQAYRPAVRSR